MVLIRLLFIRVTFSLGRKNNRGLFCLQKVLSKCVRITWKEKGIEYQLMYRNVEEKDEKVIKQSLLYIANKMK